MERPFWKDAGGSLNDRTQSFSGDEGAGMKDSLSRAVPLPCLVSDHFQFACYSAQGPHSRVGGLSGSAWCTGALLDQGDIQASSCTAFPRLIPKPNLSSLDERKVTRITNNCPL